MKNKEFIKFKKSKKFPLYPCLTIKVQLDECKIKFFDHQGDESSELVSPQLFEFSHPSISDHVITSISINYKQNLAYVNVILTRNDLSEFYSEHVHDEHMTSDIKLTYY